MTTDWATFLGGTPRSTGTLGIAQIRQARERKRERQKREPVERQIATLFLAHIKRL